METTGWSTGSLRSQKPASLCERHQTVRETRIRGAAWHDFGDRQMNVISRQTWSLPERFVARIVQWKIQESRLAVAHPRALVSLTGIQEHVVRTASRNVNRYALGDLPSEVNEDYFILLLPHRGSSGLMIVQDISIKKPSICSKISENHF